MTRWLGPRQASGVKTDDLPSERSGLDEGEAWLARKLDREVPGAQLTALNQRILARVQERRRGRGWFVVMAAVSAAAVAIAFLSWNRIAVPPQVLAILEIEKPGSGQRLRGDAQRGDYASVRVRSSRRGDQVEVRVYRDEVALFRCDVAEPCKVQGEVTTARFQLRENAAYRVVVLAAPRIPPARAGSYDRDTAAAIGQGAQVLLNRIITLR